KYFFVLGLYVALCAILPILPTLRWTSCTISLWLMTLSSYCGRGARSKKMSCPLFAATSACARAGRSVLLMWSTFTWTSFCCPHCGAHVWSSQSSNAGTKCAHVISERSPLSQRPLNLGGP